MSNEIMWGSTVLVLQDAPTQYRPGSRRSVCGFRDVEPESDMILSHRQTRLYLVEFSDGEATEIPASLLERTT